MQWYYRNCSWGGDSGRRPWDQIGRVDDGSGRHKDETGDRYVSISIEISRLDGAFALSRVFRDFEQAFTGSAGFHPKRPKFSLTAVSHWYYLFAGFQATVSHRPYFSKVCSKARIESGPAIQIVPAESPGTEG
jgi:hypothetical protein